MSRRPLLRRRALLGGATLLAAGFAAGCALPVIPKRPQAELADAWGWLEWQAGRYRLRLPRAEMGQGIAGALRQVAAEALDLHVEAMELLPIDTGRMAVVRATVGSESVQDFALPLAQACAALREAVARGATRRPDALPPSAGPLALRRDGRSVGRSLPQPDDEALLRGQPLFVADLRRPGLLHGRVLRAPASPLLPSRCVGLDEAAARADPDFVALFPAEPALRLGQAEGVGLVARSRGALERLAEKLAPRWQVEGRCDAALLDEALSLDGAPQHTLADDRLSGAGAWPIDLQLDVPAAAHAGIEPRCALAEPVEGGGLQLWVGSQDPFYVRDEVANRLGLRADTVRVHAQRIGGGFGSRAMVLVETEAAWLAQRLQAPVRVQWTREQEFQQGFHRPPSRHRVRVRLSSDGLPSEWWHRFASGPVIFSNAALPPWLQRITRFVPDKGIARGALPPYRLPKQRIGFSSAALPLPCGPWRGLGAGPNGLAVETAIDACAKQAGADALDYRLRLAPPSRLREVLLALRPHGQASAAPHPVGWRHGRGLACGVYKETAFVAVLADVAIDPADGRWRVLRMVCVHDCGLVINPDRVRAQCEGNLVWGLGMVQVEALPLGEQGVAARQFMDSPIPRLEALPEMRVELVESVQAPGGAGESALVAAGAAVLNALHAASGWRPTELPVRPAAVLAALQERAG
jgi:isoquinoline 1-oxidoreductase subunit beta